MNSMLQDLRYALRQLAKSSGFTGVAVLTLALGIGANSALFTIVNAVILRPLPYPHAERLLSLSESDKGVDISVVSGPTYAEWLRSARSLSALAAYAPTRALVRGAEEPELVDGLLATASYFTVMAVSPARGRAFTADEDRPGGPAVVVLSDQLWRRMFAADSALIGRTALFDGKPQTVIGIMPPSFTTTRGSQYWMPMRLDPAPPTGTTFYYYVLARLRPDASIDSPRAELAALARRLDAERSADQRGRTPVVMTLHERRHGDTRPALLILLGAVGVLLLIACANVCNLLLARGARRRKEFAVRLALGASRWRLIRYLLVESVALSLSGGVLGLFVAFLAVSPFVRIAPATVARVEGIEVDATVLGFTFAVAVMAGVIFGLIPALEAGRADLGHALSGSLRATGSARQHSVGRALIVFELATTLVLLTCAGLLTHSFARVMAIDYGFRPECVLVEDISLQNTRYSNESAARFFTELLERVRTFPGVEAAALADVAPLGGARMSVSTRDQDGRQTPVVDVIAVSPGYFATTGTPVLTGRDFGLEDRARGPRVAMINATLAHLLYSGVGAVGRRIGLPNDSGRGATIVGVVKDVPQRELEAVARPAVFVPADQAGLGTRTTLLIRTPSDPIALQQAVREAVRSMDAGLPAPSGTTMEQVLSDAVAPRRFSFVLLAIFGLLAATLAAVGLYGVLAYLVADRTREIGIRLALGAEPLRLVRLVVEQGMWLAVLGVLIGLGGSFAAVRLLRHMLFGVSIYDPWAFVAGTALLGVVALVGCLIPARRATQVDPMVALRSE